MEMEHRTLGGHEVRASGDGKLTGYAAVFNKRSENLGGFVEVIQRGAFSSSLDDDIRALVDHEGLAVGRTKAGTLSLREDDTGLAFELDLPESRADVLEAVNRGDVDQMSFGFSVREGGQVFTEDDEGMVVRTLTDVRLFEVSIVTFPAYPDTSVAARSVRSWQEENAASSLAELTDKRRSRMSRRLSLRSIGN